MSTVYFEKGINLRDLEKGTEFEVDPQGNESGSEEESFYDESFEDYKKETNEAGIKSKDILLPFNELELLMKPVTEDGCVMKQVIKWGTGIALPEKSIVVIHYDAFLENQNNPFDSTRLRNRPFKFLIGDGSIILGLEFGIRTMKKDELAKLLVDPQYAYGKMGCPPRIPGNAKILYIVEVLNFYDSKEAIEFEDMTPEEQKKAPFEKIAAVYHCEHKMGNDLFRNRNYKQAIARYRRMVKLLEHVSVSNEEEDQKRTEYLLKLYLNLSLSYANIKNSSKAIVYADLALKLEENNAKALYRMGCALFIADEFNRAKNFLNKAKQYKPYEKNINRVLLELEQKRKQHMQWENMFCKKMFATENVEMKTVSESQDVKEFREVLDKEFKKFVESKEKELRFSPGYIEWQIDIVKELAAAYKLAFVSKIFNDSKILKVAK